MGIPFIDLKAQFKVLEKDIRERINDVLEHGRYIMGPEITELEENLAGFAGVRHALSCSSGTDALLMPLMARNVGPGDAVFTTPFTFYATAEVVALLGATPVFVDIDPVTFNIDPEKLKLAVEALEKKDPSIHPLPANYQELTAKAVIPVDLFGIPAEYDEIMPFCEEKNLFVIEDTAQGFGGEYKGRKAGALAHCAATSFFPAKPLGGYGDGGAVFTDDEELAKAMTSIRIHGMNIGGDKYLNELVGLNARCDSLQAAVLLPKLAAFPGELDARQRVADRYSEALKDLVTVPFVPEHCKSAWAQYSILTDRRDELQKALGEEGVPTMIYYPIALHQQPVFRHLGYKAGDFPVSEDCCKRIISLPMHPYLDEETQDTIIAAVRKVLG